MAPTIRIFAVDLSCFLCFGAVHDTQNINFRCGSVMFSVFRSVPWHSKFAFLLRMANRGLRGRMRIWALASSDGQSGLVSSHVQSARASSDVRLALAPSDG